MLDLEQIAVPAFSLAVEHGGTFRYKGVNALNETWSGTTTRAIAGRTPHDIFDAAIADRLCGYYSTCVSERRMVEYEVSAHFVAGRSWWKASLTPILGPSGEVETLVGTCSILTDERRGSLSLETTSIHLDMALRCLKGADWRYDIANEHYIASPNLALLMGEDRPRPVAWSEWAERVFPEDQDATSCNVLVSGEASEQVVRFRYRGKDDETRWAQCRRLVTTEGRATPIICGIVTDVTDERRRELNLEAEASQDGLTGLLNRRGFKDGVDKLSASAAHQPLALVMLDLDGFKLINDRLGHAAGDAVLIEVGERLTALMGPRAVVGRLGGDEFIAALDGIDESEATALAREVSIALSRPFFRDGLHTPMGASVGLSWRRTPTDLATMMVEADGRLYREKQARKRIPEDSRASEAAGQIRLFAA